MIFLKSCHMCSLTVLLARQFAEDACGSVPAFTDPAALCARFSRPGAVRRALLAAARPGRAAAGPRGEGRAAAQPGRRRGRGGDPLRHGLPRGRGQGRGRQVRARAGPGGPATPAAARRWLLRVCGKSLKRVTCQTVSPQSRKPRGSAQVRVPHPRTGRGCTVVGNVHPGSGVA